MECEENMFNLEKYLTDGVENIVKGIIISTLKNTETGRFMMKFKRSCKRAAQKRHEKELLGEHIPPFLIAGITNACNLHCTGCYARANKNCFDEEVKGTGTLNSTEWGAVFSEAEELGIPFILLAGGEPMLRTDVLEEAGKHRNILFPVFTNGTLLEEKQLMLLQGNPNLLPVISVEGGRITTDKRRGDGVYEKIQETMKRLCRKGIAFGTSITVTKENQEEVMSEEFAAGLQKNGCKAIIYVEYVPVNELTEMSAPDDADREKMRTQMDSLRRTFSKMLFISFPGDEKSFGGCLAAGRGFFHINAFGSAEPCPFSAYSDTNVKDIGIRQALKSPLFTVLNEENVMNADHVGGCVLFEKRELVESLCERIAKR